MALREFMGNDQAYLKWLAEHHSGYVINTLRSKSPSYMVLHRATCAKVSDYNRMAKQGGFTERQYIKICSAELDDLREWLKAHGRPDGSFSGICRFCAPPVAQIGHTHAVSYQAALPPQGEPLPTTTSSYAATELFAAALNFLRENYTSYRFFQERDIVWTVQLRLMRLIEEEQLPFVVFNDYPMIKGTRRSLSADLAILLGDHVHVAAEFKYEPSHHRNDIPPSKFPVVFWGDEGVGKDINRVREFVERGRTLVAYSIFIDEGGHFRYRNPHQDSEWFDWSDSVSVLISSAHAR